MQDSGGSVSWYTLGFQNGRVGPFQPGSVSPSLFRFWADLPLFLPILTDEANRTSLVPKQLSKTTMYNPLSSSLYLSITVCSIH